LLVWNTSACIAILTPRPTPTLAIRDQRLDTIAKHCVTANGKWMGTVVSLIIPPSCGRQASFCWLSFTTPAAASKLYPATKTWLQHCWVEPLPYKAPFSRARFIPTVPFYLFTLFRHNRQLSAFEHPLHFQVTSAHVLTDSMARIVLRLIGARIIRAWTAELARTPTEQWRASM